MNKKYVLNRAIMAINHGMSIRSAHKKYANGFSYSTFYRRVKSMDGFVSADEMLSSQLSGDHEINLLAASEILKKYKSDIEACLDAGMKKKNIVELLNKFSKNKVGYSFFCRSTKKKNRESPKSKKVVAASGAISSRVASASVPEKVEEKVIYSYESLKECDFLSQEEKYLLVNGHNGINVRDYISAVKKYRDNTVLNIN